MAGAACGLAASCRRHSGTGFPGYALVATAGENSVAVIDLMDFRVNEPIPLGAPPSSILPGPDGFAYVLTPSDGRMHIIGPSRKVMGSLLLGPGIAQLRHGVESKSIFAISTTSTQLLRADTGRYRVSHRYELKASPRWMDVVAAGPGHDLIATSSGGSAGWVELLDVKVGTQHRRRFDVELGDLRFRADAQLLLVSNLSGQSLLALSVPALDVIAELPLAMQPQNLCFNRDQGQLFVTGDGMDGVAIVFPYRVLQVDQTVLAGRDPGVMACSANPALLFVASASGSDVCVLNIDSRKVIGLVDVAQHAAYITITPDDQYALVLNKDSGDVAFIRIPAIRTNPAIVISKSGASLFTMLPVGREPVHAAVIASKI